jgi:hypothetical protein
MRAHVILRGRLAQEFSNHTAAAANPERAAQEFLLRLSASNSPDFIREWHGDRIIVRRRGDFTIDEWPMPGGTHG